MRIGRLIGIFPTVALVVLTGALGAWLARTQGLRTLARVRQEWRAGRLPTDALLDGLLILMAGAVLLTPGVLTDLMGFFLLTPYGRGSLRLAISRYLKRRFERVDPKVIIIDNREQKS